MPSEMYRLNSVHPWPITTIKMPLVTQNVIQSILYI